MDKSIVLKKPDDLKVFLATNYLSQIKNFFGEEKRAMKFLSSVMADVQKTPKLLDCDPTTLINSYMTMAQLGFMPSGVSGEAYVLPYFNKGVMTAQFQLGYQGFITLFYKAGVQSIVAEIVRKNDSFSNKNGEISHEIDIFKSEKERGEAVGAYVMVKLNGELVCKAMNKVDILALGQKFSKSFTTSFSPWKEENDPQLWMWKKTVLKQIAKLLPKNETIHELIAKDNEDGELPNSKNKILETGKGLQMGNLLKAPNKNEKPNEKPKKVDGENQETNYPEDTIE